MSPWCLVTSAIAHSITSSRKSFSILTRANGRRKGCMKPRLWKNLWLHLKRIPVSSATFARSPSDSKRAIEPWASLPTACPPSSPSLPKTTKLEEYSDLLSSPMLMEDFSGRRPAGVGDMCGREHGLDQLQSCWRQSSKGILQAFTRKSGHLLCKNSRHARGRCTGEVSFNSRCQGCETCLLEISGATKSPQGMLDRQSGRWLYGEALLSRSRDTRHASPT
ncbi:hypothetical protein BKA70DRAFT_208620 [Coprinopsis sp. MPI-PUGE-AT-0042]|nr:hypothetical protein BKA70DRAFT_208620 [Coprinopsis sp. MPI-PUGE-AT-0042]